MDDLARLNRPKRGTGRLDPPAERESIGLDIVRAIRAGGASSGAGIASPLTEQEYTGDTWYQVTSSDGLFVFEFADQTTYEDAAETEIVVVHRDPDA